MLQIIIHMLRRPRISLQSRLPKLLPKPLSKHTTLAYLHIKKKNNILRLHFLQKLKYMPDSLLRVRRYLEISKSAFNIPYYPIIAHISLFLKDALHPDNDIVSIDNDAISFNFIARQKF